MYMLYAVLFSLYVYYILYIFSEVGSLKSFLYIRNTSNKY